MQKMIKAARLSLIYVAALLLTAGYPLSAMAETMDDSTPPASTTVTPETQTAPVSDPAITTPAPSSDTAAGTVPSPASSTSQEPTESKEPSSGAEASGQDSSVAGKDEQQAPVIATQSNPQTASTPVVVDPATATANSESSKPAAQQTANAAIDDTTKNAITNAIDSGALSGDATVKNNTKAGNATSGDASAAATIINNVNSTVTNDSNQKAATFVSNVMGNVHGDIILQPMLLKAMLEAAAQQAPQGSTSVTTTNQLVNDITLDARSGNATVAGNTQAGNATSGDANAVANVLNIVNSMISANRSFVGTINIYGSLDGDILIAPDFIPQLIANNGAKESSATSSSISSKDTQSIVNNIALAAETKRDRW